MHGFRFRFQVPVPGSGFCIAVSLFSSSHHSQSSSKLINVSSYCKSFSHLFRQSALIKFTTSYLRLPSLDSKLHIYRLNNPLYVDIQQLLFRNRSSYPKLSLSKSGGSKTRRRIFFHGDTNNTVTVLDNVFMLVCMQFENSVFGINYFVSFKTFFSLRCYFGIISSMVRVEVSKMSTSGPQTQYTSHIFRVAPHELATDSLEKSSKLIVIISVS